MTRFYPLFIFSIVCSFPLSHSVRAQSIAGFEDIGVPVDSFFNGSDAAGGFTSGQLFLPNDYSPEFQSWTGWAISTKTDTLTRGFTNQYSAITGAGYAGSPTYAVNFGSAFAPTIVELTGAAQGGTVPELYLTNSTYAYYSMLEGDGFTKRFGGETGADPDFLRLTFRSFLDGNLSTDSIEFYLADYRFADNSQDYILQEWTRVDLSSLGATDSLQITMRGSDVGMFGLNTPSYFCMDAVTTLEPTVAVADPATTSPITVYPNPCTDRIQVRGTADSNIESIVLYDLQGRLVRNYGRADQLELTGIKAGTYLVQIISNQRVELIRLIKN